MTVQWRIEGFYKADAQKVADEIGDKKITPQEIVDKAKDERSELHKCFEWDNDKAAEQYRIYQARYLLSMLVFTPKETDVAPVRVFSLTSERKVYQPTMHFVSQIDEHQALLKRALMELEAFRKKYSALSELEEIFETLDKFNN